jgi:hypothetical protein
MEKFAECVSEAHKKLVFSKYLLEKTYPMVQDPKMLLSVISNIYYSLRLALLGVLYFELFFKRVKPFSDDLNEQICIFEDFCVERYPKLSCFSKELSSIQKIIDAHKDSSVEFAKNEEVRMFDENYHTTILSYSDVSNHISNAKVFIDSLILTFDVKIVDAS